MNASNRRHIGFVLALVAEAQGQDHGREGRLRSRGLFDVMAGTNSVSLTKASLEVVVQ